ncbi:MAG: M48 family metallopeptidase [Chitinivibrionia bacterium]|nr:M48 family metallopeptidase [Chitinivibrionia bacterium]
MATKSMSFTSKKQEYVGIATQQWRNNLRSVALLAAFPILVFALLYAGCYALVAFGEGHGEPAIIANELFFGSFPFVGVGIFLWFIIAYFTNVYIIDKATGAHTLERKENKRVYNLVENLCISCGMQMPKLHVIEDRALNAFASGVSKKSYTVTLTRGIIDTLDDKELEGVIAHELMHIRNNDVRVLIISIVFVGIFAMIAEISMRSLFYSSMRGGRRGNSKDNGGGAILILLAVVLASVGYGISILMRFAISRKREYMADAGAAELTKNPLALANALRKISGNPVLQKQDEDIAQMFIEHRAPKEGFRAAFAGVFATHPPIAKRISVLEQF